ncbi:MAG: PEP-CTERM sorting domain-containing protein [Planctomycetota bacterium]|nr:PEP-CTERM sorting domain-containing protein [Planctomycetota bacterium]
MKARAVLSATTVILGASVVFFFASSGWATDIVLYQENFNSYANGTLLTAVAGWYSRISGGTIQPAPTIQNGRVETTVNAGFQQALLDFPSLFSHGNAEARIEFDSISGFQADPTFGWGTASAGSVTSRGGWEMGPYHSPNLFLTTLNGTAFDQSTQNLTSDNCRGDYHYVIGLTLSGITVTWTASYTPVVGGTTKNLMGGVASESFDITDPRGINTFRFYGASYDNWPADVPGGGPYAPMTLDNIKIVAVVPEPATLSLLALGGLAVLRRRR